MNRPLSIYIQKRLFATPYHAIYLWLNFLEKQRRPMEKTMPVNAKSTRRGSSTSGSWTKAVKTFGKNFWAQRNIKHESEQNQPSSGITSRWLYSVSRSLRRKNNQRLLELSQEITGRSLEDNFRWQFPD